MQAFCVAALVALAAEATFFNFQPYLKFFVGPEFRVVDVDPNNPNILLTSDGTPAEINFEANNDVVTAVKMTFKDLNREVTSVFVEPDFGNHWIMGMFVQWSDEESTRGFTKTLYSGLSHENHTAIQPNGKVSELMVVLYSTGSGNSKIGVKQVAVNKRVPFYFSGLRLFVVSLLAFAAFCFFNKTLRSKASYYLFEYKFDPANKMQNRTYAYSVAMLILFAGICAYSNPPTIWSVDSPSFTYNKYLVDALISGKVHLDFENHPTGYGQQEKMLEWERPYDPAWRDKNGYSWAAKDFLYDASFYKGKYTVYFGVVPAVILYVPYKLITGNYLPYHAGTFLFAAVTILLLAMLWRYCVKMYMPDMKFAHYLLSFFALFFGSALFFLLRFPALHTTVQMAGIMFSVAGILLLLKSIKNEKISHLPLFFACLCLALVVGCRPSMIFVSLLVPVVLWKYKSWKLLSFVVIPYIMVAIPLCVYNYLRYDSIFEFGQKYCLTWVNVGAYNLLNPIGKIIRLFAGFMNYLFCPNVYSHIFPFVDLAKQQDVPSIIVRLGTVQLSAAGGGMINFPIVFCLLYLFKNIFNKDKPQTFRFMLSFLVIASMILLTVSSFGFYGRYMADAAFLIILPSLFCAYYWCNCQKSERSYKTRMKTVYVLLAVSILVGLFLYVNGDNHSGKDPALYRYLEYSLGIFRAV